MAKIVCVVSGGSDVKVKPLSSIVTRIAACMIA